MPYCRYRARTRHTAEEGAASHFGSPSKAPVQVQALRHQHRLPREGGLRPDSGGGGDN
jgi:hypothetical protein